MPVPGQPDPEEDQPLPDVDLEEEIPEAAADDAIFPEEEAEVPAADDAEDSPATKRAKSMNQTWLRLVE